MDNHNPSQAAHLQPRDLSLQYQALRMKLGWEAKDQPNAVSGTQSELTPPLSTLGPATDSPYPALRAKGLPGTTKVHDRPNVPKLTVNTKVPPLHKHPWNPYTHRPKTFMRDRPHLEGWESGTTPNSVRLATYLKDPGCWDDRWDTEPPTPADNPFTPNCDPETKAQVGGWLQEVEEDNEEGMVGVRDEDFDGPPETGPRHWSV